MLRGITLSAPTHHSFVATPLQIKQHASRESCWFVRDSKVYDATAFLDQHPGGAAAILGYAGGVRQGGWRERGPRPAQGRRSSHSELRWWAAEAGGKGWHPPSALGRRGRPQQPGLCGSAGNAGARGGHPTCLCMVQPTSNNKLDNEGGVAAPGALAAGIHGALCPLARWGKCSGQVEGVLRQTQRVLSALHHTHTWANRPRWVHRALPCSDPLEGPAAPKQQPCARRRPAPAGHDASREFDPIHSIDARKMTVGYLIGRWAREKVSA